MALSSPAKLTAMKTDLEQLMTGGEQAVADLLTQYRERLERMLDFRLNPRLRSRVDPADVLQEAYIEIARRIGDYLARPEVSFYVWARQITLQTLIGVQRRHFGQKRDAHQEVELPENSSDATSYSLAQALCAQNTTPSRAALRAEEIEQLHSALATMDQTDQEVLAMRHFEHLSNQEVAEALGLSTTAASNRYVRAMTRLAEILKREMS